MSSILKRPRARNCCPHTPSSNKDETFILLRGKVRVLIYDDDGELMDKVVLCHEGGRLGVIIPKNVWHTLECLESAVLFECKEGPFMPHED